MGTEYCKFLKFVLGRTS